MLAVAAALPVIAAAPSSGIAVGDKVTAFHPDHITGPHKGTDTCLPCTYGARPQVQVWLHGEDMKVVEPMAKVLNAKAVTNKNFKALLVFVTGDKAGTSKRITDMVAKTGYDQISTAILPKNSEYVKDYKISLDPEVTNTVFVYKDRTVKEKFVNWKADDKGITAFKQAVNKIAG